MRSLAWFLGGGALAILVLAVAGGPAAAAEAASVGGGTERAVAFTFKGSMGGGITVIDHRAKTVEDSNSGSTVLNQTTSTGLLREAEYRTKRQEAAERTQEAYAERRAAAAERSAGAAEAMKKTGDEAAEKQADLKKGLAELREKNWVTHTSDDKHFPKTVYDPITKQNVPTEEAIRRIREQAQPKGGE